MLFAPTDPERQARTWDEHAGILRAIIAGDERAAATLAAEHVMRAGADFLATLHIPEEGPSLDAMSARADTATAKPRTRRAAGGRKKK
jgi:hypothetical protein